MKTLLSVNSYYYRRDGSEVIYLGHNRLFEQRGWRVVPFAMKHPENLESEWSEYFVTDVEFGLDYSLLQKLIRIPKVIYSVEARRAISRLVREVEPDVCHMHSIYHHLSPSILGEVQRSGIPTIMTLHDLKIACPAYHMFTSDGICERCKGGKLQNVVRHRCVKGSYALSSVVFVESILHRLLGSYERYVDRFVVPCQFYIDKLVEWGWPRERFVHIPNFVDVEPVAGDQPCGQSLLYLGRLSPEKGLLTLVRAAAAAGVNIRIAGHGPEQQALEAEASALGADVQFLGHLDVVRLKAEILASRATVLAAEWYENAPMSVLESLALGRPVVGANVGGIPELIRHGENGWLFERGSVDELATVLRQVLDTPDHRIAEMGEAGRNMIAQEFSSQRYGERISSLYAEFGVQ